MGGKFMSVLIKMIDKGVVRWKDNETLIFNKQHLCNSLHFFFRHSNLYSFTRQLRNYGFHLRGDTNARNNRWCRVMRNDRRLIKGVDFKIFEQKRDSDIVKMKRKMQKKRAQQEKEIMKSIDSWHFDDTLTEFIRDIGLCI